MWKFIILIICMFISSISSVCFYCTQVDNKHSAGRNLRLKTTEIICNGKMRNKMNYILTQNCLILATVYSIANGRYASQSLVFSPLSPPLPFVCTIQLHLMRFFQNRNRSCQIVDQSISIYIHSESSFSLYIPILYCKQIIS